MVQIYLSMSLRSVVNVIKLIGHNVEKTDSSDEFGDPSQKYLCITLGPDRGVSAGIPYVLEIWPSKCGSPIHNHGNCFAVINVIHGAIDIEVFNKHVFDNDPIPIKKFTATKVQHTWISPNWF